MLASLKSSDSVENQTCRHVECIIIVYVLYKSVPYLLLVSLMFYDNYSIKIFHSIIQTPYLITVGFTSNKNTTTEKIRTQQ